MLRGIFGPILKKVTIDWRKLYKEGLHDGYSLPHTFRLIK
jgi:hypothetical protein